jgi:hypothetical protein
MGKYYIYLSPLNSLKAQWQFVETTFVTSKIVTPFHLQYSSVHSLGVEPSVGLIHSEEVLMYVDKEVMKNESSGTTSN